jgi:hypothetical protein
MGSTWVGSGPTLIHQTSPEKLASDKHASLLCQSTIGDEKQVLSSWCLVSNISYFCDFKKKFETIRCQTYKTFFSSSAKLR